MALADAVFQTPARQDGSQVPVSAGPGGPVKPGSEGGRAGDLPVPGAVSGFTLPKPRPPKPFPRPQIGVGQLYDVLRKRS
jgi:hypothetical protein